MTISNKRREGWCDPLWQEGNKVNVTLSDKGDPLRQEGNKVDVTLSHKRGQSWCDLCQDGLKFDVTSKNRGTKLMWPSPTRGGQSWCDPLQQEGDKVDMTLSNRWTKMWPSLTRGGWSWCDHLQQEGDTVDVTLSDKRLAQLIVTLALRTVPLKTVHNTKVNLQPLNVPVVGVDLTPKWIYSLLKYQWWE